MKTVEKKISKAVDEIVRAMQENLKGSITFHFKDGLLVSMEKVTHKKLDVDLDN